MISPTPREVAITSIAVSLLIVVCGFWWLDREQSNLEKQSLRRRIQSLETQLHEFYSSRSGDIRN
jgi:hypothetical protein